MFLEIWCYYIFQLHWGHWWQKWWLIQLYYYLPHFLLFFCCPCSLFIFVFYLFLPSFALIEHFTWFFFSPLLGYQLHIFLNYFDCCPWVFSIRLRLSHLCEVILHHFTGCASTSYHTNPSSPCAVPVTLLSVISLVHKLRIAK